jgi:hypothetical protein
MAEQSKSVITGSSVERFFKRNSGRISMIGALIVFGTFIAKDAIRENIKDLVDSLDSAQNMYQLQRGNVDIMHALKLNRDILDRMGQEFRGVPVPAPHAIDKWSDSAVAYSTTALRESRAGLERAMNVAKRLPDHGAFEGQIKMLDEKEAQLQHLGEENIDAIWESAETGVPHPIDNRMTLYDWIRLADSMPQRTKELTNRVIKSAEETAHTDEHRYKVFTWISYFLYTLGWTLGIANKRYGGEELGAD